MISFLEHCQLEEAFTNPLPIKVTSRPRSWTATFTVPATPRDKTYEIEFNAQGLTIPDKLKTTNAPWVLSFADITSGPGMPPSMYGVTGGGDAFVIFATVIHTLKVFARLFATRPFILFTAKEASRQKLYDRFVRVVKSTVPGMHGFGLINTPAVRAVLGNAASRGPSERAYVIVPTHISLRTVHKMIGAWHKKTDMRSAEFLGSL
jgi:hypothetical protein